MSLKVRSEIFEPTGGGESAAFVWGHNTQIRTAMVPGNNLGDQLMLNRSGIILCIPATKNDQVLETGHAASCIVPEIPCRIEHADED